MRGQYLALLSWFSEYIRAYGGWSAIVRSPFIHISLLICVADYSIWTNGEWIELSLQLAPNLLGFSLGAYAILFSFLSPSLRSALHETSNSEGTTGMQEVNAAFFHFIVVQVLCIVFALVYKGT